MFLVPQKLVPPQIVADYMPVKVSITYCKLAVWGRPVGPGASTP